MNFKENTGRCKRDVSRTEGHTDIYVIKIANMTISVQIRSEIVIIFHLRTPENMAAISERKK